jgi:ABC-2 type transport system permease protein
MKKIWTIIWKDVVVQFRDRNALVLMLVAPLALSAIVGATFGDSISSDSSPIRDIPLIIVNDDTGGLSEDFIATLNSEELADLLEVTLMDDLAAAREIVVLGEARAVVHIPAGFSNVFDDTDETLGTIELYTDPAAVISPIIIHSVVSQIVDGMNSISISAQLTADQLGEQAGSSDLSMLEVSAILNEGIQTDLAGEEGVVFTSLESTTLNWTLVTAQENTMIDIDPLAFFAPSMGIFFLMFTALRGARSILEEQTDGTLDRLMSTPTGSAAILSGKLGGTILTGILQFATFVVASSLLFSLGWGSSIPGLILMTLAVVAAFTSLGAVIAAFSKDVSQAATIGSLVILVFAALGGNFFPADNYPAWLQQLSKISINRWALDGFTDLTIRSLDIIDILPEAAVLFVIAAVLFALGTWQLQHRIAR